jgi:hypothetical protein
MYEASFFFLYALVFAGINTNFIFSAIDATCIIDLCLQLRSVRQNISVCRRMIGGLVQCYWKVKRSCMTAPISRLHNKCMHGELLS